MLSVLEYMYNRRPASRTLIRKYAKFSREAKSRIGGKNIPTLGLSTDALLGYDHAKFQKKRMRNLVIFESPFLRKLSAPENF